MTSICIPKFLARRAPMFLATILLLYSHADAQQDVSDFVKRTGGSVAAIQTARGDGRPLANGTGFVTQLTGQDGNVRTLLITNRHVMRGAASAIATFPGKAGVILAGIVAEDAAMDLVAVELETLPDGVAALPLAAKAPDPGARLVVIGNPAGLSNSVSDGLVAAVRDVEGFGTVIQMTAPISPGSSGSPVFTLDGSVAGVATFQLDRGQNLNFAIPATRVAALSPRKAVPIQTWSGEQARRDPETAPIPEKPSRTRAPLTWQEWIGTIGVLSIDPDPRSSKRKLARADPIAIQLTLTDFYLRVGQPETAGQHLDAVIALPDVSRGESRGYDEHIVRLLWRLEKKLAASMFAASATKPGVQTFRLALIARCAHESQDAEGAAKAINGIRSIVDSTPNPQPPPSSDFFGQSNWRMAIKPRVDAMENLCLAYAWVGETARAQAALTQLASTARGNDAAASMDEVFLRRTLATYMAGVSQLEEAERLIEPISSQEFGDSAYMSGLAAIAKQAFSLGDRTRYVRIIAIIDRQLAGTDAEKKAAASGVVDAYLVAGNFERAVEVASKITSDSEKAWAVERIVRRYAEIGDRSSARQLVSTISSIPGQFRALVAIAETSIAAGDTASLDATIEQMEGICKKSGVLEFSAGRSKNLPLEAVVRFGYVKGMANPPEALVSMQFSSISFGELRPTFLIGIAQAVWEQETAAAAAP